MQPNVDTLTELYASLDGKDHQRMAACYAPDAMFEDIAFHLEGRKQIHAMWHMIAETDLRASFEIIKVDEQSGTVRLIDNYTFRDTGRKVHNVISSQLRLRDGLIIEHRDSCNALNWGIQALGPLKGVGSWLFPAFRRAKAKAKLEVFIARHPEYA